MLSASDAWLERVRRIQSWQAGGRRAPHKPLLLLYMLGRLQREGQASVAFKEVAAPLTNLLRESSPTSTVQHPEYPFYHLLSDDLWQLHPQVVVPPGRSPSARQLRAVNAVGSLPPDLVTALKREPRLLGTVARYLLDANFEPSVHQDICEAVGLDLASLEVGRAIGKLRDPTFRARILLAYECRCAVCGYEGQVKGFAVGLDAAHARWWASGGPDAVDNGLCLCSLHHKLLDSGVLGLTDDHRLLVSMHFVARTAATRSLVLDYTGRELIAPQAGQPRVASGHIAWHRDQVFKAPARAA